MAQSTSHIMNERMATDRSVASVAIAVQTCSQSTGPQQSGTHDSRNTDTRQTLDEGGGEGISSWMTQLGGAVPHHPPGALWEFNAPQFFEK